MILQGEQGRGIEGQFPLLKESTLGIEDKCVSLNSRELLDGTTVSSRSGRMTEVDRMSLLLGPVLSTLNIFRNPQNHPMREVQLQCSLYRSEYSGTEMLSYLPKVMQVAESQFLNLHAQAVLP